MDIHPHNNPTYKEKIIESYVTAVRKNQIVKFEDPIENEFNAELKKTRNLFYAGGFGSTFLAYLLDKRYFKPAFGERFLMRINCMLGIIILGPSLVLQFRDKARSFELTQKVAFKYETQLLRLYPELNLYWQLYQNPSAFLPPQDRSAQIYPNQPAQGYPNQPAPGYPNQPAPGYPNQAAPIYPNQTAPDLPSNIQSQNPNSLSPRQNIPDVGSYSYPSYTPRSSDSAGSDASQDKSSYPTYYPPK